MPLEKDKLVLGNLEDIQQESRDALLAEIGPMLARGEGSGEELIAKIAQLYGRDIKILEGETIFDVEKEPLSIEQKKHLMKLLKSRFHDNMRRHKDTLWMNVKSALLAKKEILESLWAMESKGHQPDLFFEDENFYYIGTCTKEAPIMHRRVAYDNEAQKAAGENFSSMMVNGNAENLAEEMGTELMSENEYRKLQENGKFDEESRVWLKTDPETRKSGKALVGCRQFKDFRIDSELAWIAGDYKSFRVYVKIPKVA